MEEERYIGEIDYKMIFITYEEWKKNRIEIWERYRELDYKRKRIYKMYVYSSVVLKMYQKDEIWEFLNGHGIDYLNIDNYKNM